MRLLPYGDRALLVEVADTAAALAWARGLERLLDAERDGGGEAPVVAEWVPAARTVLLVAGEHHGTADLRRVAERVVPTDAPSPDEAASGTVEIEVVYDGEDLEEVAALTGLGAAEVVAVHTGQTWTVAFGGFAPGFGYLVAEDPEDHRLHVPRRSEPRSRVPAGAVGLAGEYAGVYPRASPGGWQLLGRTDARLWDLERPAPALLRPGVRVRFRERT